MEADLYQPYDYGYPLPEEGTYQLTDQSSLTGITDSSTSKTTEERGMVWAALCGFLIISLILGVAFILVFVLSFDDSDVHDEANVSSGGGLADITVPPTVNTTVVTAPRHRATRARVSPTRRKPMTTTMTTTAKATAAKATTTPSTTLGPTTVTTPPPPLLCSVGATPTALRPLLPPDGLCDIVIYAHVRLFNHTLRPVFSEMSFHSFRNVCESYARTTCGVSFDARQMPPPTFASIPFEESLEELKGKFHIDHYGILNVYGSIDFVDNVSRTDVPRVLTTLRRILGEDDRERHKVFVGVGYRYFNTTNAWKMLAYTASNLASKDLDILVIITTFLTPGERNECITLPVNAMKSPNHFIPTLDAASVMAKAAFARPSIVVAFTFQMGVPFYTLTNTYDRPIEAMYEPCTMFGLADYSQACQADTADLNLEKAVIGLNKAESITLLNDKKIFQSHDKLGYMTEKAKIIMERPDTRVNLSWFLWNVHLTDPTRTCLTGGPFERVKGFRDFFYRQAQMPKG